MNKRRGTITNDWFKEFEKCQNTERTPVVKFRQEKQVSLSNVSDTEREFIWEWCESRNLDDIFAVVALTYWVRARAEVAVDFLLEAENKRLYMVLCIHIALKWLGYDEQHKCDFFADLVGVHKGIKAEQHRRMEIDLLKALSWEM